MKAGSKPRFCTSLDTNHRLFCYIYENKYLISLGEKSGGQAENEQDIKHDI